MSLRVFKGYARQESVETMRGSLLGRQFDAIFELYLLGFRKFAIAGAHVSSLQGHITRTGRVKHNQPELCLCLQVACVI